MRAHRVSPDIEVANITKHVYYEFEGRRFETLMHARLACLCVKVRDILPRPPADSTGAQGIFDWIRENREHLKNVLETLDTIDKSG